MTYLVHINGQSYAVPDADVGQVESRLLEAVHAGGGFVDSTRDGGRPTRELVSPASHVRIEKLPESVESSEDGEEMPDWGFLDFDA